jgi:hypothetical protein
MREVQRTKAVSDMISKRRTDVVRVARIWKRGGSQTIRAKFGKLLVFPLPTAQQPGPDRVTEVPCE